MVEVPSAALLADRFASESAFFSVGTNDLTQYTLAVDRGHPKLGSKADALDPGVLRLIARTAEGARPQNRPVGVCGGLASEARAVPILVGLGVDDLSVSIPEIPVIKALIRRLSRSHCETLAKQALASASAAEVRALVDEAACRPGTGWELPPKGKA
jgi:phosphoenolpyruvate-protein kinase (PTS system EI component)